MTEEGSNVTMCESGDEQKSGQGDLCRLQTAELTFQLKLSTTSNYHQSNAEHSVKEEDGVKDEDGEDAKEGEDEDVEDEEEVEEEKKLHTTPNLSVRASARLR